MGLPRRAELLLMLASTLACLVTLEGLIRADLLPMPDPVLSDGWHRERWLRRHAGGLKVAKRPVDRFDPLLGWTLVENLDGVRMSGASVHSNSAGMRGRREYQRQPGPGLRIVVLGDSFTFGQCVGDDETFAARLERRIAPGEVLNLAVHGYGNDQQLLRLRQQGLAYRPDLVMLGFVNADVNRNQLGFRDYAKPRFLLRDGELVLENVPLPTPEEYARAFHLRSANYARMLWDTVFAKVFERHNRRRSEAILREILSESRKAGARLGLVFLPGKRQAQSGFSSPRSAYMGLCASGDALCIDPTARTHAFLQGVTDPAAHFSCHYSPAIHGLIAEEIASALEGAGMLAHKREEEGRAPG